MAWFTPSDGFHRLAGGFSRSTREDPQSFCANWWFYESWEWPESGRASGHNNPPQGGPAAQLWFQPKINPTLAFLLPLAVLEKQLEDVSHARSSSLVFEFWLYSKRQSKEGFGSLSHFTLLTLKAFNPMNQFIAAQGCSKSAHKQETNEECQRNVPKWYTFLFRVQIPQWKTQGGGDGYTHKDVRWGQISSV